MTALAIVQAAITAKSRRNLNTLERVVDYLLATKQEELAAQVAEEWTELTDRRAAENEMLEQIEELKKMFDDDTPKPYGSIG